MVPRITVRVAVVLTVLILSAHAGASSFVTFESGQGRVGRLAAVPGGVRTHAEPGWTANATGTSWNFVDPAGAAAGGITQVTLRDG